MRLCIVLSILAICWQGCCNCTKINEFGNCVECNKCTRDSIDPDLQLKVVESKPFESEAIEKTDVIFTWGEVYQLLGQLRSSYLERLQNCSKWCQQYSDCKVRQQAWNNYWQQLVNAAIAITTAKETLIKRLSYLHSQRALNPKEKIMIKAFSYHLENDLKIYSKELVKLIADIQGEGGKLPVVKEEITTAVAKLEQTIVDSRQNDSGALTIGSTPLAAQLRSTIANIKTVPVQK